MINFTFNNHLKYSIGGREFGVRHNPYERYVVTMGGVDAAHYKKSSWREELWRTADCVLNDLGNDLVVFLSGGTDSEIVVRNFLEIGYRPRCITIEMENDYNRPDVEEAKKIARELSVPLEIIPFNVKNFYKSGEALDFAKQVDCSQITYLMVYYHVLKLGFPAVMGGEQFLKKEIQLVWAGQVGRRWSFDHSFWYHCFRENEDASAMRFSNRFDIPLINEWFSYTPEMIRYFIHHEDVQSLIGNHGKYRYKLSSVSSKNAILRKLYPSAHYKKKTHGFEKLLAFNGEVYGRLEQQINLRLIPCLDGVPVADIL